MLSRAALVERSLTAPTAVERRRWAVLTLVQDGLPVTEIARAVGLRARTVRELAQRYATHGPAALVDRRTTSPGAPPLLTPALRAELTRVLRHAPTGARRWTGPLVAQWIAAKTGRPVHRQRGWEYLRLLLDEAAALGPDDEPRSGTH